MPDVPVYLTESHLTEEDRAAVEEVRNKGLRHSREANLAHGLSCLDRGIPEAQILAVLGIGRMALWRTRSAYLQDDVELAVSDVARSGRPTPDDSRSWRDCIGVFKATRRHTAMGDHGA